MRGRCSELEREQRSSHPSPIHPARRVPLQAPAVDLNLGVGVRNLRDAEAGARDALFVQQRAAARIGDRGVGQHQLMRCKAAGIARVDRRADPEERQLDAEPWLCRAGRRLQLAGQVPPLGPVRQVGAEVARECQQPGCDRGVVHGLLR